MRKQVVRLTGILNVTTYREQVTRGDFARMLVNTSSYRENLPSASVSVFADVPGTNPNAVYIRIAASQGWMTGFLGGLFKPDEYITYKEAAKALLEMSIDELDILSVKVGQKVTVTADALMRGNQVYVKDDTVTQQSGPVPAGFRAAEAVRAEAVKAEAEEEARAEAEEARAEARDSWRRENQGSRPYGSNKMERLLVRLG